MKTRSILMAAVLFTSLISCGSKANSGEKGEAESSKSTPAATEVKNSQEGGQSVHLTKEMFLEKVMDYENSQEWKYQGELPAIIDFYADWCGPCRIASPILDELAAEYEGKIIVYKIDTEVERELAAVFGIRSLPTFLFIPMEGQPMLSNGIARSKEETKQMFVDQINKVLLNNAENTL